MIRSRIIPTTLERECIDSVIELLTKSPTELECGFVDKNLPDGAKLSLRVSGSIEITVLRPASHRAYAPPSIIKIAPSSKGVNSRSHFTSFDSGSISRTESSTMRLFSDGVKAFQAAAISRWDALAQGSPSLSAFHLTRDSGYRGMVKDTDHATADVCVSDFGFPLTLHLDDIATVKVPTRQCDCRGFNWRPTAYLD